MGQQRVAPGRLNVSEGAARRPVFDRHTSDEGAMDLTMLTYALFQSATPASDLPTVLAARGTVGIVSTPLGIALGGPLVCVLGGAGTLVASGMAPVLRAAVTLML